MHATPRHARLHACPCADGATRGRAGPCGFFPFSRLVLFGQRMPEERSCFLTCSLPLITSMQRLYSGVRL